MKKLCCYLGIIIANYYFTIEPTVQLNTGSPDIDNSSGGTEAECGGESLVQLVLDC